MKDKIRKYLLPNLPYLFFVHLFDKLCQAVRLAPGLNASEKLLRIAQGFTVPLAQPASSGPAAGRGRGGACPAGDVPESEKREEISPWR